MDGSTSRRALFKTAATGGLTVAGLGLAGSSATAAPDTARGPGLPSEKPAGEFEVVAAIEHPLPTGVTVSQSGRVFINFPRWEDEVEFTVAELVGGKPVPYPNPEVNRPTPDRPAESLLSVQSVVVDPLDRLWVLDTGSIQFEDTVYGGPKLVCVDLARDEIVQKILVPPDVALPTTYLNDVRFDLRRGAAGTAFITDSSDRGPNGIIVVDLDSGRSWRRLHDHPSTKAEPGFLPVVEGRALMSRSEGEPAAFMSTGSDGIAMGHDGKRLFYCPLASRRLHSVSVDALADPDLPEEEVAATVADLGDKGGGADGLESDAQGRVYLTNYEHNAILRRNPDGAVETLVHDPRLMWPDTLSLAHDGHLYAVANQLHRRPAFHDGQDLREPPYAVVRVPVDAQPVQLKP